MEEVTVKNYQELAMRTCLPSAKNWEYCYCLIASEIGEAFGKWGKKFRDGSFDKDKLADELGDVFWGIALACELWGYSFEELWGKEESSGFHCASIQIDYHLPNIYREWMDYGMKKKYRNFKLHQNLRRAMRHRPARMPKAQYCQACRTQGTWNYWRERRRAMTYKTLLKRGYSKRRARKLATPRKLYNTTTASANRFNPQKILSKTGLSRERVQKLSTNKNQIPTSRM